MLIELKGNNYYSKVFKRVNYKLQNNTFWVVINALNKLKERGCPKQAQGNGRSMQSANENT